MVGSSDSNAGIGGIEGVTILDSSLSELWLDILSLVPSTRDGGGVCVVAGEFLEGETPVCLTDQQLYSYWILTGIWLEYTELWLEYAELWLEYAE